MNWSDKMWWWANKKPKGGWRNYGAVVLPWFALGMVSVAGSVVLIGETTFCRVLAITLFILLVVLIYDFDRRDGYIEALHKRYLERRKEFTRRHKIEE